jgi:DNA-directed RNA polymerase subunit RPC12/RpoP
MAVKIIRCPYCGEEIVLKDLYEDMEIRCDLCDTVLIYRRGKFLNLDTNEEYDLDELEGIEEEFEEFEDFEDEEFYFDEDEF